MADTTVFICYRKDPDEANAGRLRSDLGLRFGAKNVFVATASLAPGTAFPDEIAKTIRACDVFLLLVGKGWNERLKDGATDGGAPQDWVRYELDQALESGRLLIPVCIEGANLPARESMPSKYGSIAERHAHVQHADSWDRDVQALVTAICRQLGRPEPPVTRPPSRLPWIITGAVSLVAIAGVWYLASATPDYVETNGVVFTRQTAESGVGAVTGVARYSPLARVRRALDSGSGTPATDADRRRLSEADRAFRQRDYRAAERAFRDEALRFPENLDLRLNLALALMLINQANASVELLRSSLADLDSADPRTTVLRANLAQAFLAAGQPDSAAAAVATVSQKDPNDPVAENAAGVAAYQQGDYGAAAQYFEEAATHGRVLSAKKLNLATALFDSGDSSKARSIVDDVESEKKGPTLDTHALRARLQLAAGDLGAALRSLVLALALGVNRADLYFNKALAFERGQRPDSASAYYDQARKRDSRLVPPPQNASLQTNPIVEQTQPTPIGGSPKTSIPLNDGQLTSEGPQYPPQGIRNGQFTLRVIVKPRSNGPQPLDLWVPGVEAFGSEERSSSYNNYRLTYYDVTIGPDGRVRNLGGQGDMAQGSVEFKLKVVNWLSEHELGTFSSEYRARIEIRVEKKQ